MGSLLGVIWPCANLFSAQFVQHVVVMPVWDTWETYSLRTNASELEVRGALSCAIKLVILFQVFFISSIFSVQLFDISDIGGGFIPPIRLLILHI